MCVLVGGVAEDLLAHDNVDAAAAQGARAVGSIPQLRNEVARQSEELHRLRRQLSLRDVPDLDLDRIPFGPTLTRKWLQFPSSDREHLFIKYPLVPSAPTGREALLLSRELKWPDEWKARQRPEHFILGPPKTGTTFLAHCLRLSMVGNTTYRPYPLGQMRWPVQIGYPEGEPIIRLSPSLQNRRLWNRTGFRRWDPPKEWWVYPAMGKYGKLPMGFLQRLRLPPVEEESKDWVLMDATPDQLMIYHAADAAAEDLRNAPFSPRFLVLHRNALDRAYSHFLLFTELRRLWGWQEETELVFANRLHAQHKILRRIPICEKMLHSPEEVMADINLVREALRQCMYDPDEDEQPMYLPFGFAALGAKYWVSKFHISNFRFARTTTLKTFDEDATMTFLEATFGLKRMLPRCTSPKHWRLSNCTGQRYYDQAYEFCGKNSQSLKSQAWTKREGLKYSKGPASDLLEYQAIADKWAVLFDDLLVELDVKEYSAKQ